MSDSKVIYISHANEEIEIVIPSDKVKELTCHWLLEETITKLKRAFPHENNFGEIVALCTVNRDYAVDHWLTFQYRNISILNNRTILKPFYRQRVKYDELKDTGDDFFTKTSLDDFIVEIALGYGAFSKVYLVRKKDTGALYALKQISKNDLNDKKKKLILRERQAMVDLASSSHIVSLRYTFQTENHCYFVQDFVPCGDMHHVISRRKLTENEVRFYLAETILGLNAIHGENYMYRDLKPENLLLDLDGHIRITDFGLAKKVDSSKCLSYSYCGTYEVMAPEIIRDQGYNVMVDYYNLGTLAYELVTGRIPRLSERERLFLLERSPTYQNSSEDFKDFVQRLLEIKPENRLGAIDGLKEICSHPWLSSINMSQLNERNIKPPLLFDPNYIHFKNKSPIKYDIDQLDWGCMPLKTTKDNTLLNFSFYGLEDCSLNLKMIPSIEKNCHKGLSKKTIGSVISSISESFQSLSTKSSNSIAKTKLFLEKEEQDDLRITEMDVETESVTIKFENYKPKMKKSVNIMKQMTQFSQGRFKKTLI